MSDGKTIVRSIATTAYPQHAFIACQPSPGRGSKWAITSARSEAYEFDHPDVAKSFASSLERGEAYGLQNDGHRWMVVPA